MSLYPTLQHAPHPSQQQQQQQQQQQEQNNVLYAGWLQKKGDKGVVLLWKKRYFIVDKKSIRYFTDQTQQEQKGSITWETISGIEFTNSALWNDCRYFQIETVSKRVYYLFTEDQVVSLDWVTNLQKIWNFYKQSIALLGNNSSNNNENNTSSNVYDSLDNNYKNNVNNFDKASAAASPTNSDSSNGSVNSNNNNNNVNNYGFDDFNNNSSNGQYKQYKDFLNYSQPYYNHFYDNIGKPIQQQSDSLLNVPPRPPGPLRELNQELVKEILPMEGKDLEFYYQSTVHFSNLLLTSGTDYILLSCYLILSILDWDNKKTQPLPYACTPPYESDIVFPYFTYTIQLVRNEILNKWPQQGPTYCTQIDLFSKKKRKNFPLLLENEDRETFLQRNLLLLNYILKSLLTGNRMATIEDSVCVLIDRFLENYESLPSYKYGNFLWKEIEQGSDQNGETSSKDKLTIKNILTAYLLYQKLHLEKKNNTRLQFDSLMTQRYDSVGHKFSQQLHQFPLLAPYQGHIQRTIVRIFFLWQKDLPLCETTSTYDVSIYRNYKVFSRMLQKTNHNFPQLQSAIKEVRDSLFKIIENQMGSFDINNIDSTSLDSIINN
ncbi:hypothetical protein DICPUDRAFT_99869 [Dictyostelium purpureum]|uniref:PH domain-containing protein n=1 Tax=Dictyostelium purpureum TaxID=5786 RepID=F1A3A0_DICPU|nr:uncharacterized protein DICPUDRAFT_99869 [Dictyostelium purpureum]EGC29327.1 hypothetical protein DICPUDRAFT_99869 [Dictyostelium purpureum]|eukprot:XP_003294143.1 hypothetical protein DICPUDRAFT_99869 [Dictyostelium purpureum]